MSDLPVPPFQEPPSLVIDITVDDQVSAPINESLLRSGVVGALRHRGFDQGQIGIRVTDDPNIRVLNAEYLGHDYPTDVISFGYAANAPLIEGEMVVSIDTASRSADQLGWAMEFELCLYVVHGTLHITGMEDQDPDQRSLMRSSESIVMKELGIESIERFSADRETLGTADATEESEA